MATFLIETPFAKSINLYVHVKNLALETNNGNLYETFNVSNWTDYAQTLVEVSLGDASALTSLYQVTVGSAFDGAKYGLVYERLGATPASTDTLVGYATITQTDAVTVPTSDPYSVTNLQIQLTSIQTAINAALVNPKANWQVGQVSMDQSDYLAMLLKQQGVLIKQLKEFPSESIDTLQHAVGALGDDLTDYHGEEHF